MPKPADQLDNREGTVPSRTNNNPIEWILRDACAELDRGLRGGLPVDAGVLLKTHPELGENVEHAVELIYTEFVTREELGQRPNPRDLYNRYPQWCERLQRQLDVHRLLQDLPENGAAHAPKNSRSVRAEDPSPSGLTHPAAANPLGLGVGNAGEFVPNSSRFGFTPKSSSSSSTSSSSSRLRSSLDRDGAIDEEEIEEDDWDDDALGSQEPYQLLGEIGRGGMGVVYKALQPRLNRVVALKMILAGPFAEPHERMRFRREARMVAQLQHPNIIQIFQVGEHRNRPYVLLEYADGGNLANLIQGRYWPADDAARLVETLARAMQYAHDRNIIHRDLKPANILLTSANVPKISDFGLAKFTENQNTNTPTPAGAVLGTPSYMAPEQAAGETQSISIATDIYALGAILYELITGRPPFQGRTFQETLELVQSQEPKDPGRIRKGVSRDLLAICALCLKKSPAERYGAARDLADDLRRYLARETVRARRMPQWLRLVRDAKRHIELLPAVVGVSLAVISVSYGFWVNRQHARIQNELDNETQARRAAEEWTPLARHSRYDRAMQHAGAALAPVPVPEGSPGTPGETTDVTARVWLENCPQPWDFFARHVALSLGVTPPAQMSGNAATSANPAQTPRGVRLFRSEETLSQTTAANGPTPHSIALAPPRPKAVAFLKIAGNAPSLRDERVRLLLENGGLIDLDWNPYRSRYDAKMPDSAHPEEPRVFDLALSQDGAVGVATSAGGIRVFQGNWSYAYGIRQNPRLTTGNHAFIEPNIAVNRNLFWEPIEALTLSDNGRLLTAIFEKQFWFQTIPFEAGPALLPFPRGWETALPVAGAVNHDGARIAAVFRVPTRIPPVSADNPLALPVAKSQDPAKTGTAGSDSGSKSDSGAGSGSAQYALGIWVMEQNRQLLAWVLLPLTASPAVMTMGSQALFVGDVSGDVFRIPLDTAHGAAIDGGFSQPLTKLHVGSDNEAFPYMIELRATRWSAHHGPVTALAVSDDGRTLVTSGQDGVTRFWSGLTLAPWLTQADHPYVTRLLRFSSSGNALAQVGYQPDGRYQVRIIHASPE